MRWPEKTYLLNRERRFVYCPIPKVAMTSIKLWVLLVAEGRSDPRVSYEEVSERLRARASFRKLSRGEVRSTLRDPSFFKFVFVRNPWSRLVSAYIDKFLPVRRQAREVIAAIRARERPRGTSRIGRPSWIAALTRTSRGGQEEEDDCRAGITFRQFIEYLGSRDPGSLNRHWRPQHLFLGRHEFDFVGKLERLDEDFGYVRRKLDIAIELPRRNATAYAESDSDIHDCLADWPPERLRALDRFPGYRSFYSPDLAEVVGRVYAADAERFGYTF